jgi:hypothetical protein
MLSAYGSTPERNPEAARRTRAGFMAELEGMFVEPTRPGMRTRGSGFSAWSLSLTGLLEFLNHSFTRRSARSIIATLMLVTLFLFSGVGITAYAASSSLPGDTLYSVKTTIESVRVNLTLGSAEQARLSLDFAKLRLIEMHSLIVRDRYDDISLAAKEYERDVQKALRAAEHLSQTDPLEANALNLETASVLRIYRAILSQMLILVPDDQQPAIQSAIGVSQPVTGSNDDDDATAGPAPIPTMTGTSSPTQTNSQTPAGLKPESIQENSTPTPIPSNNNNANTDDRNDDSGKDNGSNDNRSGDDDGDDDGENDDGGDDDGIDD